MRLKSLRSLHIGSLVMRCLICKQNCWGIDVGENSDCNHYTKLFVVKFILRFSRHLFIHLISANEKAKTFKRKEFLFNILKKNDRQWKSTEQMLEHYDKKHIEIETQTLACWTLVVIGNENM